MMKLTIQLLHYQKQKSITLKKCDVAIYLGLCKYWRFYRGILSNLNSIKYIYIHMRVGMCVCMLVCIYVYV